MTASRTSYVVAGCVVILVAAVVVPVASMFVAQSAEADRALAALAVNRATIAEAPRLETATRAFARRETEAGMLIGGGSTSLAAANMQNLILDIVQRHGGQLRSSQALASSPAPSGLERIVVQYEVSLPPGSLLGAAYELESRAPYLFVDAAEIRPELYGGSSANAPSSLHVSWTIHAYRRVAAP